MITIKRRNKKGYTFNVYTITEHGDGQQKHICNATIICRHRPNLNEAKAAALNHVERTLINFVRFATPEEAARLGDNFSIEI